MSSWINETAVPNHNGNGFPHINDPSAVAGTMMDPSSFMGNPTQFNAQFANPQQMGMTNGPMRNASPSFANPMYQTNPVIPSKRPRPREDGIGQSPRPAPGMLPTSRAETPQQSAFQGFQQPGMPQQPSGQPSPYPHLQTNGSANATPSPIMGNQMRPGSVPQRVASTSPHPFSPAAQQFPQASPIASEHGGTPQPYMQQNNFQQNFNPQFTPGQSPARPSPAPNPMAGQMMPQQMGQMSQQQMQQIQQMQQMAGQMPNQMAGQMMPGQMAGQMAGQMPGQIPGQMGGQMPNMMFSQQQMAQPRNALEQQKLLYQMQLQQQAQRTSLQMQQMGAQNMMQGQHHQNQAQARNMMAARQGVPNGQMPPGAMRQQPGVPQQQIPRVPPPEQFMKHLTAFMNSKNLTLDVHPVVEGRQIPLYNLFQFVYNKAGGYRNTTQSNVWPQVSQFMGFPPQQCPGAPQQFRAIYERNLLKYEELWAAQQKMRQQQQGGMLNAQNVQQGTPTKAITPGQMPPQMMQPGQQPQLQQAQTQSPIKPPGSQQPGVNGFPAGQPPHGQQPILTSQVHTRNSLSRSVQATPTADDFPLPSPAQSKAGTVSLPGSAHPESQGIPDDVGTTMKFPAPFATKPDEYMPCSREVSTFGGADVNALWKVGDELQRSKIDVPLPIDLGNVDIHALTKSIQSGIHGELRLALDTLASLTCSDYHFVNPTQPFPIPQIDLRHCDELVEALVECAEDQLDLLVENSEEASNEITISAYEDLMRACRVEKFSLRNVTLLGSQAYEIDRAVDRLICITTVLRNLSWREENHACLADDTVIKFICVLIRYLGTREMLLRTHGDTLDLMKDLVTLLSNIASSVEIPGREQAFCLLHFLLAFAPTPGPTWSNDRLLFASYDPSLHPYLPHAVDCLAKLLARDEPNRTFYKAIFAAEAAVNASPPCELLTRTFGLAISPIPDHSRDHRPMNLPSLVEARKPLLMQGLLAADIMAGLAPGFESGVTRAWLASGNGFAQNLFLLARQLSVQYEGPPVRTGGGGQQRGQPKRDSDLVYIVGLAVSMLRRLTDKARDPSNPVGDGGIPPDVMPAKESVLNALQMQAQEWAKEGMLADLLAYASFGE
jgi:SWI/SNF chromatin-remodeling complex subunit SWI1